MFGLAHSSVLGHFVVLAHSLDDGGACVRRSDVSNPQCNACLADYFLTEMDECLRYCGGDGASMPPSALLSLVAVVAAVWAVAG